ncbi:hypothetical protein GQR60_02300 [Labilibaculum sp. A4]|uniref:Uncharacterized protein n=1 Tax=Labilibaculum euxinus TaxID=2686357 RepID=A0A7M4D643_9BACT|nr:hypothetical protein [Labilibaculum euxinus]MDQ1770620.1 hypothetical protein [Labilibaculum euxinus]MUP38122.1 hypothetical protein [Labilibaculum euxinus]MVB07327.1 hypothetical protein [Labilibaculum euxinus]MWN75160.1 hypothetical protein [Labilibaculum euxinus]
MMQRVSSSFYGDFGDKAKALENLNTFLTKNANVRVDKLKADIDSI